MFEEAQAFLPGSLAVSRAARRMKRPLEVLALVTDAFGGRGGIAQYNRDFLSTLVGFEDVSQSQSFRAARKITLSHRMGLSRCAHGQVARPIAPPPFVWP